MSMSDPSLLMLESQTRAITFENPTGEKGRGGTARGGRKGRPNKMLKPGDNIELRN
jgi:hypothetical protein